VSERRARVASDVDLRARAPRQFHVSGDEIGVQMRFEDVRDAQLFGGGALQVHFDVALRVDHHRLAVRTKHV
jgi:hypothetical protein